MCEILRRFAPQDDNGKLINRELFSIQENILLSEHTTFRIGGAARYFCVVKSKDEIISAVKWARENNLPFFILGGGSNLLVSDKGFDGLVIEIKNAKFSNS